MTDALEQISGLLHEAGETHHRVFRIVDGADDDWASWYAQWLIDLSELPDLLGARPVRSELIYLLVSLDKQYTAEAPRGTLGDLLRTADSAPFPAIRQLTPLRTPDGLAQRQYPVMPPGRYWLASRRLRTGAASGHDDLYPASPGVL